MSIWKLYFNPYRLLRLSVIAYLVLFTFAAWYKYNNYRMGFDLAVHEQVLWNTSHGRVAATSAFASTSSYFGIDFIPTELLLAPLYAIRPSVQTMLFLQTLAVALGAIPVFQIVRNRFQQQLFGEQANSAASWAGLVFAIGYLLYLPVEYANLYEFQIRTFATTFLLFAWQAMERRQLRAFLIWSLLALGCRSEVGIVLAGMGLYVLLEGRSPVVAALQPDEQRRQSLLFGALPIVLGLAWFVLSLNVIVPAFRNGEPSLYLSVIYGQIDGQAWLGNRPAEIFTTLFTRPFFVLQEVFGHPTRGPMRLRYLLEMFLPFGFLLLLQPRILLITIPIFGLNLLSNTPNIHASTHYHYQTLIVPFMVIGSAYALCDLLKRWANRNPERPLTQRALPLALTGMFLLALLSNMLIFAPAPFNSRNPGVALLGSALKNPGTHERVAAIQKLLEKVPADAALATTNKIGPFAAQRERIFFFPGNVIYPADKITQAEFLLIDQVELLEDAKTRDERQRLLDQLASDARFQRVTEIDGLTLWKRVGD